MLAHLVHPCPIHAHTVMRLDPLPTKVYGSNDPMRVVVVHRNEDDVL